jgi:hypothetical protein
MPALVFYKKMTVIKTNILKNLLPHIISGPHTTDSHVGASAMLVLLIVRILKSISLG